jgi:hypothetical protein
LKNNCSKFGKLAKNGKKRTLVSIESFPNKKRLDHLDENQNLIIVKKKDRLKSP